MRFLTDYLLRHRFQALIFTFVLALIPVLGLASILVAALFTLCAGVVEGAIFTFAATLPYILAFVFDLQKPEFHMVLKGLVLAILSNVMTYVFAILLRRNWSWSNILQVAALLGVLAISIVHLAYPDVDDWWASQITHLYNQSLVKTGITDASSNAGSPLDAINSIKQFATGFVVAYILLTAIVQLMLARWWQVVSVNQGRLGKEFYYIRLSSLTGLLFLAAMVFAYLENRVVLDILPVLCLLFGGAGLSLTCYLCGLMEPAKRRFWISLLYIALIYAMVVMALYPVFVILNFVQPVMLGFWILAISLFAFIWLGFLDIWFDMRRRKRKV